MAPRRPPRDFSSQGDASSEESASDSQHAPDHHERRNSKAAPHESQDKIPDVIPLMLTDFGPRTATGFFRTWHACHEAEQSAKRIKTEDLSKPRDDSQHLRSPTTGAPTKDAPASARNNLRNNTKGKTQRGSSGTNLPDSFHAMNPSQIAIEASVKASGSGTKSPSYHADNSNMRITDFFENRGTKGKDTNEHPSKTSAESPRRSRCLLRSTQNEQDSPVPLRAVISSEEMIGDSGLRQIVGLPQAPVDPSRMSVGSATDNLNHNSISYANKSFPDTANLGNRIIFAAEVESLQGDTVSSPVSKVSIHPSLEKLGGQSVMSEHDGGHDELGRPEAALSLPLEQPTLQPPPINEHSVLLSSPLKRQLFSRSTRQDMEKASAAMPQRTQKKFDIKDYFEQLPAMPAEHVVRKKGKTKCLASPGNRNNTEEPFLHQYETKIVAGGFGGMIPRTRLPPKPRSRFTEWSPDPLPNETYTPHILSTTKTRIWPEDIPQDIFREIGQYLSFADVKNLRLVNHEFANQLASFRFQSVVVPFGPGLFDVTELGTKEVKALHEKALISEHASKFRKFGISFEYDLAGLIGAAAKPCSRKQQAWWGSFKWPAGIYSRHPELQWLENLADSQDLLRTAFEGFSNMTELGLSVDSGHGWLGGFDLSDLEVWDLRCHKDEVFGSNFSAEDVWHKYGREQIFRGGQEKIIDVMLSKSKLRSAQKSYLKALPIRSLESFRRPSDQHDLDTKQHTGGTYLDGGIVYNTRPDGFIVQPDFIVQAGPLDMTLAQRRDSCRLKPAEPPQYPTIVNGLNIAAEISGHDGTVFACLPEPDSYRMTPDYLTKAQAQWLLETYWAQRAFLSSYLTSVLENQETLHQVHSLHISKISSGLLDSLGHEEFWKALPQLHTVTLLVIPDWRRPHDPGDDSHNTNMRIQPVDASIKLAHLLRERIAPLEKISHLKVGYIGGGEHAKGLFSRNRHVLPVPLTTDPQSWLLSHTNAPDPSTMISLDHVQNLTLVNSWVSPSMLQTFMTNAKDSSLKHLTLDSISMTVPHVGKDGPFPQPIDNDERSPCWPNTWIHEVTPTFPDWCVWAKVFDEITPGRTFNEYRVSVGLADPDTLPPREDFIGNIQRITFKSCGYVRIATHPTRSQGSTTNNYNQSLLIPCVRTAMDSTLSTYRTRLKISPALVMKPIDSHGKEYKLLGKINQAVHETEKTVLEQCWGMTFGWGDRLERWECVDDGWFEGGTGRFSGVVRRDGEGQ